MANANTAFGLRAVGHLYGSGYIAKARRYYCPSGDGSAIYLGDPVKSGGTADSTTGLPTITVAAAGDTLRGVAVGFDQVDGVAIASTVLSRNHRPASTAMYVWVVDDPNVIFEVQEDAVGATTALVDIGENADIIYAAGSATTGISGVMLDSSDHKTATAQLRILGFSQRVGNEYATANSKLLVVINEHELKSTTGV